MNSLMRWQRPGLAAWSGFGHLTDLRDEINRLFDSPLAELTRGSQLLSGWTPAINVFEDKDNVYVKAELPGMKKEEIEVSLHDGTLSISGERKVENKVQDSEVYRAERFFGRFHERSPCPRRSPAKKSKRSTPMAS